MKTGTTEPESSLKGHSTELYHSWAEDIADLVVLALIETVLILLVLNINYECLYF